MSKKIFTNIYNSLNTKGSLFLVLGLPEKFYGKSCPDFVFPHKKDEMGTIISLQHGDEYPVILGER